MSFDNLCKLLAEKHPDCFATWLLGEPSTTPIEVLKTELSIEPIRADSVTFLHTRGQIACDVLSQFRSSNVTENKGFALR
jgi:predicted transposase YdaD